MSSQFSKSGRRARVWLIPSVAIVTSMLAACEPAGEGDADRRLDDVDQSAFRSEVNFDEGARSIKAKYEEYAGGFLDIRPDGPPFALPGGVGQSFTGGAALILWSPSTGAHTVWWAFKNVYEANGIEAGIARYGYPRDDGHGGDVNGYCRGAATSSCQYYERSTALCTTTGEVIECTPPPPVAPPAPPVAAPAPVTPAPHINDWVTATCYCTGLSSGSQRLCVRNDPYVSAEQAVAVSCRVFCDNRTTVTGLPIDVPQFERTTQECQQDWANSTFH